MGLGLMVVGKSGETFYANLWLPGRYWIDHILSFPDRLNQKTFCATLAPSRFSLLYTYAACLAMIISLLAVKRLVEVLPFSSHSKECR